MALTPLSESDVVALDEERRAGIAPEASAAEAEGQPSPRRRLTLPRRSSRYARTRPKNAPIASISSITTECCIG
jgi:hypothetical protein